MTVDEILVVNLGDSHVEPHMLVCTTASLLISQVRTELNDIIIYKPFQYTPLGSTQTTLRFTKVFHPHLTREPLNTQEDDEDISLSPIRMFALPTLSGHAAVFVCGPYPGFILKTVHSLAQFYKISGESVQSVCQFNVINGVEDGFLYYDSTVLSCKTRLKVGCYKDLSTSSGISVSWKVARKTSSTRKRCKSYSIFRTTWIICPCNKYSGRVPSCRR